MSGARGGGHVRTHAVAAQSIQLCVHFASKWTTLGRLCMFSWGVLYKYQTSEWSVRCLLPIEIVMASIESRTQPTAPLRLINIIAIYIILVTPAGRSVIIGVGRKDASDQCWAISQSIISHFSHFSCQFHSSTPFSLQQPARQTGPY